MTYPDFTQAGEDLARPSTDKTSGSDRNSLPAFNLCSEANQSTRQFGQQPDNGKALVAQNLLPNCSFTTVQRVSEESGKPAGDNQINGSNASISRDNLINGSNASTGRDNFFAGILGQASGPTLEIYGNQPNQSSTDMYSFSGYDTVKNPAVRSNTSEQVAVMAAPSDPGEPSIADASTQTSPVEQPEQLPSTAPTENRSNQNQASSEFDPYSFYGEPRKPELNANNDGPTQAQNEKLDPYSFHGEKPARPQGAEGEAQWGDRRFRIHADGSAEYSVSSGDTVWYVATDVLKARLGRSPSDAEIFQQVNEIAQASGLTQNGRSPHLIYPDDKLIVPPARPAVPLPDPPSVERQPDPPSVERQPDPPSVERQPDPSSVERQPDPQAPLNSVEPPPQFSQGEVPGKPPVPEQLNYQSERVADVIPGAEAAINWAANSKGDWYMMCLGLVNEAYKQAGYPIPELRASTAGAAMLRFGGRLQHEGNPPRGAIVFYDWVNPNNGKNEGHVAISLGDGTVLGSVNGPKGQQVGVTPIGRYRAWVIR